jgi:hypothetical protein
MMVPDGRRLTFRLFVQDDLKAITLVRCLRDRVSLSALPYSIGKVEAWQSRRF